MAKKGGWFGEKVRHSEAAVKGKAKKLLGNQSVLPRTAEVKRDLERFGFIEVYVPYIWKHEEKNPPNAPHYLTVDFVPDKQLKQRLDKIRERDEDDLEYLEYYVSTNIGKLLNKKRILDVYNDMNLSELEQNIGELIFILG